MSSQSQSNTAMRDRNPFGEIERFFDRMSEQFEDTAEWPMRGMGSDAAVDVVDAGDAFEVHVDLPGFAKEDVELTLSDGTLRVHAEADADEGGRYVRQERHRGSVDRTVTLPERVDEEGIEATLSRGVLTVTLGKAVAGGDATTIDIE